MDKTIKNIKLRNAKGENLIAASWVVGDDCAFLAKYKTGKSQVHTQFTDLQ